jgi:hypothetical protein
VPCWIATIVSFQPSPGLPEPIPSRHAKHTGRCSSRCPVSGYLPLGRN